MSLKLSLLISRLFLLRRTAPRQAAHRMSGCMPHEPATWPETQDLFLDTHFACAACPCCSATTASSSRSSSSRACWTCGCTPGAGCAWPGSAATRASASGPPSCASPPPSPSSATPSSRLRARLGPLFDTLPLRSLWLPVSPKPSQPRVCRLGVRSHGAPAHGSTSAACCVCICPGSRRCSVEHGAAHSPSTFPPCPRSPERGGVIGRRSQESDKLHACRTVPASWAG